MNVGGVPITKVPELLCWKHRRFSVDRMALCEKHIGELEDVIAFTMRATGDLSAALMQAPGPV